MPEVTDRAWRYEGRFSIPPWSNYKPNRVISPLGEARSKNVFQSHPGPITRQPPSLCASQQPVQSYFNPTLVQLQETMFSEILPRISLELQGAWLNSTYPYAISIPPWSNYKPSDSGGGTCKKRIVDFNPTLVQLQVPPITKLAFNAGSTRSPFQSHPGPITSRSVQPN